MKGPFATEECRRCQDHFNNSYYCLNTFVPEGGTCCPFPIVDPNDPEPVPDLIAQIDTKCVETIQLNQKCSHDLHATAVGTPEAVKVEDTMPRPHDQISQLGNSIGFFGPKNGPNIGPKTGPKCHLQRIYVCTTKIGPKIGLNYTEKFPIEWRPVKWPKNRPQKWPEYRPQNLPESIELPP